MLRLLYRRELTSAARNFKTPAAIIVNNGILALVAIFSYYLEFESRGNLGQTVKGTAILDIYSLLCIIEFGVVFISTLLLTVPSMIRERKNHSFDLLMAAGVSPIKVLLAKLLATVTIVMTTIFSSCPILGIVFYVGGISVKNMFVMMMMLFVVAFYMGSIGIFCSSFCKRNITAAVSASTFGFLVILGTLVVVSGTYLMKKVSMGLEVTDSATMVSVGKLSLLLLLNPLYNFLLLLNEQLGVMSQLFRWITVYEGSTTVGDQWVLYSGLLQMLISIGFLWSSAKRLKDKKRNKRAILK